MLLPKFKKIASELTELDDIEGNKEPLLKLFLAIAMILRFFHFCIDFYFNFIRSSRFSPRKYDLKHTLQHYKTN